MRSKPIPGAVGVLAGLVFLLGLSGPLLSSPHHGNVGYNFARKITLDETVTSFDWSNPHCLLHLDVKDATGKIERWTIEMASPTVLRRQGWTSHAFKPGDQVEIDTHPAKNGIPLGISSSNAYILKTVVNGTELPAR